MTSQNKKIKAAIQALEKAVEGSADLDMLFWKALHLNGEIVTDRTFPDVWHEEFKKDIKITPVTTSLDATENTLPVGCWWKYMIQDALINIGNESLWVVCVYVKSGLGMMVYHQSLPIARAIAVLKANLEEIQ